MANIIFTNQDKFIRAKQIVALVLGDKSPKTEFEVELQSVHSQLLKEKKVDLKKADAVLLSVYKALGGNTYTQEQVDKIAKIFKKKKSFAASEKIEAEGPSDEDDEKEEDDDE